MPNQVNLSRFEALQQLSIFLQEHISDSQQTARLNLRSLCAQVEWVISERLRTKRRIESISDEMKYLDSEEDAEQVQFLQKRLSKWEQLFEFLGSGGCRLIQENETLQGVTRQLVRQDESIATAGRVELARHLRILQSYAGLSHSSSNSSTVATSSSAGSGPQSENRVTNSPYAHINIGGGVLESMSPGDINLPDFDISQISSDFENTEYTKALDRELDVLTTEVDPLVKQGHAMDTFNQLDMDSGNLGEVDSLSNIYRKYYQSDPIAVSRQDGGLNFTNGRHRVARAQNRGIESLPVLVLK